MPIQPVVEIGFVKRVDHGKSDEFHPIGVDRHLIECGRPGRWRATRRHIDVTLKKWAEQ